MKLKLWRRRTRRAEPRHAAWSPARTANGDQISCCGAPDKDLNHWLDGPTMMYRPLLTRGQAALFRGDQA